MKPDLLSISAVAFAAMTGAALADPFPQNGSTASPNVAYHYTTTLRGGTGMLSLFVPRPPNGHYYASFQANFLALGSPTAPETFACGLQANNKPVAESSTISVGLSWDPAVSAGNMLNVKSSTLMSVVCGTSDDAAWKWGGLPVEVTLIQVDSQVNGKLLGDHAPAQTPGSAR